MPKLSIPTALRKFNTSIHWEVTMLNYPSEEEMPHSIRTDISVSQLKMIELFAEANELKSMKFGYWVEQDGFFRNNNICYVRLNPTEAENENLMYMALKYGSFEKAFRHFEKEIKRQ